MQSLGREELIKNREVRGSTEVVGFGLKSKPLSEVMGKRGGIEKKQEDFAAEVAKQMGM